MLVELGLENFRCFSSHSLSFRRHTAIVGKNNAGKSTITTALRFLSLVVERHCTVNFTDPPDWVTAPRGTKGIAPSLRGWDIRSETLFHRYGGPPARLTARFEGGQTVNINVGPDEKIFATFLDKEGEPVSTKWQAQKLLLPKIGILPQVGPLAREERILAADRVLSHWSSDLASIHFRNQLNVDQQGFETFKRMLEETWYGVRIREFVNAGGIPGSAVLGLHVQDGDFVAEIGLMGHGLQMWLQTLWFLAHNEESDVIILDEPDVYLHADLQRRLIRMLKRHKAQVILATHSVEIHRRGRARGHPSSRQEEETVELRPILAGRSTDC